MNSSKLCLIPMIVKTTDINIFKNKTLKCCFWIIFNEHNIDK